MTMPNEMLEALGSPIFPLLQAPDVTEILVNSHENIWYEKEGKLHRHKRKFATALEYANFVDCLAIEAKIQLNSELLFANGQWRSFRVHLCHEDANGKQTSLSLRRLQSRSWKLLELKDKGFCDGLAILELMSLIKNKKNILVVGATGSGKTTVLNALLQEIPENERCLILEDTDELALPNAASNKILTRPALKNVLDEVSLADLLKQSLRMRPDRLVIGEVRGGEAKDLMMALATGHDGSMGTLHAANAQEALLRLEFLIQTGAPQWNSEMIRRLIHLSLHAVIVVGKDHSGKRILKEITRLAGLEETGFLLEGLPQSALMS